MIIPPNSIETVLHLIFQKGRLKFLIVLTLGVLFLIGTIPVSATVFNGYYRVAPEIGQGATVFIGEQGLNITNALIQANNQDGANPTAITVIGWWASPLDIFSSGPTVSYNVSEQLTGFSVNQTEFDGYYYEWYLVDVNNNHAKANTGAVLSIQSPRLEISIRSTARNMEDVSGKSLAIGEKLKFQIDSNLYTVISNSTMRSPVFGDSTGDGYLDILVNNESGTLYRQLYGDSDRLNNLTMLNVSISPYIWGTGFVWNTLAITPAGETAYPAGTYVVSVQSMLNNMKANYLSGSAAYTGRTVSETKTITLVPEVGIAHTNSVVRTNPFSVSIGGFPNTFYNIWIRNTSAMNIDIYDDEPPVIIKFQEGVFDGNLSTYGYKYQDGGGTKTVGMDAYGQSDVWFQNGTCKYSYALIKTDNNGFRTVEFSTTHNTKAQMYTVSVERNLNDNNFAGGDFKGENCNITVWNDNVTASQIGVFRSSTRQFIFNTTPITRTTFGLSTDIPITGDWNGDDITDIGVFRPSTRQFIFNTTPITRTTFGLSTDIPITGDWDKNGRTEIGVFRPSTWQFISDGSPITRKTFGLSTDIPIVGKWVPS